MNTIESVVAARKRAVPLIAIQTPDPAATIDAIAEAIVKEKDGEPPLIVWDIVRGWTYRNKVAEAAIPRAMPQVKPDAMTNPVEQLKNATKLPDGTILIMLQGSRYLREDPNPASAGTTQAVWNLRDPFKRTRRTLILLGPQFTLPAEVSNDVLLLDEALPSPQELEVIVTEMLDTIDVKPTPEVLRKSVDAVRGLAAFPAEQALAMSLVKEGLNQQTLWERKIKLIEQTPGLSVWVGGERLADVGGNDAIKGLVIKLLNGNDPPRVIVFIDEIEKGLAGASGIGDNTGVSQGQHQAMLTYMQDNNADGLLFLGPPGTGKSAIAKAIGGEAGILTIAFDLGAMKGGIVGESERRIREALKVITAVGGGRTLFVATCNKIEAISPELRRRFITGIFFFDLPNTVERAAVWQIWRTKFNLPAEYEQPNDDGWTGAEIRQCCLLSYRLNTTLEDTAKFVVPVSQSAADEIQRLRQQAHGRFLSAAIEGVYRYEQEGVSTGGPSADGTTTKRRARRELSV